MSFVNTVKDGSGIPYWQLGDNGGRAIVVGAAAEDGAAVGSPVLIAGKYSATPPSVDDGDVVSALMDVAGRIEMILAKASGHSATTVTADGNIYASAGVLYGVIVAGVGVTAGDTVMIKDGAGGATKVPIAFSGANETIAVPLPHPITFSSAIYADFTLTGGSGYATGIYD